MDLNMYASWKRSRAIPKSGILGGGGGGGGAIPCYLLSIRASGRQPTDEAVALSLH